MWSIVSVRVAGVFFGGVRACAVTSTMPSPKLSLRKPPGFV